MGFFDICNDDPNLTSGNYSTTQRGNNGRSYASDYNRSTFPSDAQSADTPPHTFYITPKPPDFTGLYAFEKNFAHVFLFEAPDKFSEYYINSTGKRCVSIGKYGYLQNGCFLIQCDDVRKWNSFDELIATQKNCPDKCYSREIFISYTINFRDFFVAFKQRGDTTQERINNFVDFARTHYNWGSLLKKRDYTLDDYEKMIIQKRLYVY